MVSTNYFVDADHDGDRYTRISQTGVLIFFNKAPIQWYSKLHDTVETNTFSNEFIAIKTATELVEPLRYKLRIFGIPIEGPTKMFCNNEALYKNVSTPESTLNKTWSSPRKEKNGKPLTGENVVSCEQTIRVKPNRGKQGGIPEK